MSSLPSLHIELPLKRKHVSAWARLLLQMVLVRAAADNSTLVISVNSIASQGLTSECRIGYSYHRSLPGRRF
jgi:hypothetical protein